MYNVLWSDSIGGRAERSACSVHILIRMVRLELVFLRVLENSHLLGINIFYIPFELWYSSLQRSNSIRAVRACYSCYAAERKPLLTLGCCSIKSVLFFLNQKQEFWIWSRVHQSACCSAFLLKWGNLTLSLHWLGNKHCLDLLSWRNRCCCSVEMILFAHRILPEIRYWCYKCSILASMMQFESTWISSSIINLVDL